MRTRTHVITLLAAAALAAAGGAIRASAQGGQAEPLRIGALVDMTGVYARNAGPGLVEAVKLAAEDSGGEVNGRRIEVLSADYQLKVDTAATIARRWMDIDHVSMIIEGSDSAAVRALFRLGEDKKRIVIAAGSATTALTNDACMPYGIHYVYDTYALSNGTGATVVKEGGKSWFFITADYAFGHRIEQEATEVIKANGGTVVGSVRAPLSTTDFSSYIVQAQSSGAQVVAMANAGGDFQNVLKQAHEFGLAESGKSIAAMLVFITDLYAVGPEVAQGLKFTTAFYWDRDDASRAFAKRYYERTRAEPSMVQAGAYSATMQYLKAVRAVGSDDPDKVMAWLKSHPVNDFFAQNGMIRADGRMVHDMFLAQAKTPAESKGPWDLVKIVRTIPGDQAFMPLSKSTCRLVRKD